MNAHAVYNSDEHANTKEERAARLKASGLNWREEPESLVFKREMKSAICYPTIIISGAAQNEPN